jgi:hypothetical protein
MLATQDFVEVLVSGSDAGRFCARSVRAWNADLADSNNCLRWPGSYGCGYLVSGKWFSRSGLFSRGPLTRLPPINDSDPLLRFWRRLHRDRRYDRRSRVLTAVRVGQNCRVRHWTSERRPRNLRRRSSEPMAVTAEVASFYPRAGFQPASESGEI